MINCPLRRRIGWICVLPVALGLACSKSAPPGNQRAEDRPGNRGGGAQGVQSSELWEVIFRGQEKAGHSRTEVATIKEKGQQVVRVESYTELHVLRDGQLSAVKARYTTWETPTGELVRFTSEMQMGAGPTQATGHVVEGRMEIQSTSGGKSQTHSLPWSSDISGAAAEIRAMARQPMQPGETRRLRYLDPMLLHVLDVALRAQDFQPTKLLDGTRELLRIDSTTSMNGTPVPIEFTYWADRTGEILKTSNESLGIEAYRTTREVALEEFKLTADLTAETTIKLEKPLESPHATRRVLYRVHLEGGDPAAAFVSGGAQQVRSLDAHTAEITVTSLDPTNEAIGPSDSQARPTEADIGASQLVQSDDAQIIAMAKEAAGKERDPWQVALALEQYVHRSITEKNFSQALSSAADVARSKEGDCTEHAVLLAALARARGLPARVAIGLVALRSGRAFGYHMWNEVFINGRWIPVDATLGQGGIGAGHLKVAESDLAGASAYTSFLPVVQLLGRLKIDVIESE